MPRALVRKFQSFSFRHDLFEKGDGIVVAVSGGPDSVSMLDIFSKLQKKYFLKIVIAHVNYRLRGCDSEKDEKFVKSLAERYGVEVFVFRPVGVRLIEPLQQGRTPSENELRDIRYEFFEKVRKEKGFDRIAVAHNADDQVETFLMRVVRGAGLAGLSSMRPKNGFVIRPLLFAYRREILEYIKKNDLKFRTDKTNLGNDFLRNKIRNRLIPYLEKGFNPSIRKTIFDSVSSICEDQSFLGNVFEKEYQKMKGSLSVQKLSRMPAALQKGVLRKALEKEKGDLRDVDASHIEEILKIIKSTKNKRQIVAFRGLKIIRKGDRLEIESL